MRIVMASQHKGALFLGLAFARFICYSFLLHYFATLRSNRDFSLYPISNIYLFDLQPIAVQLFFVVCAKLLTLKIAAVL